MSDRKLIGEWKGRVTMYGTLKERKIQIFKVKNQKNKIVFSGFRGLVEGTLLVAERKKPTLLGGHMGINGNQEFVFVTYSARGSHQGGPMHTYNKHVAFASKDEKILESLMKFLQKHITKGKVRRTKKTIKRGGGAKKRNVKKSKKKKNSNSAYFEFDRFLGKGKFWRIVKNGSKITTHYGKIGTLGQMNTKDYGSKVDQSFDSLIQSKTKKVMLKKNIMVMYQEKILNHQPK